MEPRKRRWRYWLAAGVLFSALGLVALAAHPQSPIPREWNPFRPLAVNDPVTPLTNWKLRRATEDPAICRATLGAGGAMVTVLPARYDNDRCHVENHVRLAGTRDAAIAPIDTSCAVALRLAMWDRHGLQPAAAELLGSPLVRINQVGSYNCRPIRTGRGTSTRMSTHATAEAIDISGFDLANGTQISLTRDWTTNGAKAEFLRRAKESACRWFVTVLSPDFNALHADHFHLQSVGWGLCR